MSLFRQAAALGAGRREGEPQQGRGGSRRNALRLVLTLDAMQPDQRARLGLPAETPALELTGRQLPEMEGAGWPGSAGGLPELLASGRCLQLPSQTSQGFIQRVSASIQVHCAAIPSEKQEDCVHCLAWYLQSDYMWLRAAQLAHRQMEGSLFEAMCSVRVESPVYHVSVVVCTV